MKRNTLLSTLLLVAALCPVAISAPKDRSAMRDMADHDELSRRLKMAQQDDPIRNLGPAIGKTDEDPAKLYAGRDLIKDSAIICYRGNLTLVPKRAVLHVPDALKDRLGEKQGVKLLRWSEFYNTNRGWIRTIEVTRSQAMGDAPFPEATLKAIENSSSLIVATFHGGPVSVSPLKNPEEDGKDETAATTNIQE